MKKGWTILRLKGQGLRVKTERGEENLKEGFVIELYFQRGLFWSFFLRLIRMFYRFQLGNRRDFVVEFFVILNQFQQIEGLQFFSGFSLGLEVVLGVFKNFNCSFSKLENIVVVNIVVVLGIVEGACYCGSLEGGGRVCFFLFRQLWEKQKRCLVVYFFKGRDKGDVWKEM